MTTITKLAAFRSARSKLTPCADDLFTRGKPRLTRWQPEPDAHITNIIGLPRVLMGEDAKQLYLYVNVLNRSQRQALFANPVMVAWARRHGIRPEESPDIVRAFYSDLRTRREMLDKADVEHRRGKLFLGRVRFSLEVCLAASREDRAAAFLQQIDGEYWHRLKRRPDEDCALNDCLNGLKECPGFLRPQCVLLVREIRGLTVLWDSLAPVDRTRLVLDLFVLMSLANTLTPVTWAIEQVPELIHEFAHLRLVYARKGPRQRRPTQRQRIWLRHLRRRQVKSVRNGLLQLDPRVPMGASVAHLRRKSDVLKLILKAQGHHRLRVRTVNP